ncbi:MAG: hypothetical protein NW208_16920 [Bryobacter sp.]|nr:hypothetical protein [Bryobacter sp.]
MSKVFALGLGFFSGAFLLAVVLALGILMAERGGLPLAATWQYVALVVLLVTPLYELSAAFRGLAYRGQPEWETSRRAPLGHLLVGIGLVVLFTLLCVGI